MKQKTAEIVKKSVSQNRKTQLFLPTPSHIPWVASLFPYKKIVVMVGESSFAEVVSSFDIYKNSFAAFGQTVNKKTPLKILNFNNFICSLSTYRCAGGFSKTKILVVDRAVLNKPIVVEKKQKKIEINQRTSLDVVVSFLSTNKYNQTDKVNAFGDFVIRGGLIDVFAYNQSSPCRLSFLDDFVKIYMFDLGSGKIIKNKNKITLSTKIKNKPTKTINQLVKKQNIFIDYKRETTTIINKTKRKTNSIKTRPVLLKDYNKSKNNFTFDKNLSGCGIIALGCSGAVPLWFKNKETKQTKRVFGDSLSVGDYYVHDSFGVCRYVGVDNHVDDSLLSVCLEFADGRVRLSVNRLYLLSFLDVSDAKISLDFLSSPGRWKRRKKNYSNKAKQYVLDLIKTYKERAGLLRPPCVLDSELQLLISSTFEHKETVDQDVCIKQIIKDLCSSSPMNRLLCGDVGFGKTEVALRAVFLALYNNKNVVVLAPTTILAKQIYDYFTKRLSVFGYKPFLFIGGSKKPVFSSSWESFLCVGTHALLYNREILTLANFLIVDEEHRFGIKDKEKIYKTNPLCDVLFMSATPLPRTLQFAISKIKTISTINTPPLSKKPIITDVLFYNKASFLIPIKNEIKRGGLVYVVENSVNNVKKTYRFLDSVLPGGSCEMLYSSLGINKINQIMDRFRSSSFSVLISTSIIESGVDIGGVNTIIVNNSHCFGLSQLYQLRGRVGRSGSQAFAFFTVPSGLFLSSSVVKRLETLKKHVVLGSGYAIALSDLKLRGPGFLLGYKQSGKVPVGFEYYSKLVSSFLLPGPAFSTSSLPEVFLSGSFLPVSFFSSPRQCLSYYGHFSKCLLLSDVEGLEKDLFSLFGKLPKPLVLFINDKKLSIRIKKTPIYKVVSDNVFVFVFLRCSLPFFVRFWKKSVSSFFNSKKTSFVVGTHNKNIKIQYKKTKKDDYILIQSLGELLYEK